jgi:hypothetical protein
LFSSSEIGEILVENRGMTLTEFYQQKSRRLTHQFGRRVRQGLLEDSSGGGQKVEKK